MSITAEQAAAEATERAVALAVAGGVDPHIVTVMRSGMSADEGVSFLSTFAEERAKEEKRLRENAQAGAAQADQSHEQLVAHLKVMLTADVDVPFDVEGTPPTAGEPEEFAGQPSLAELAAEQHSEAQGA